MFVFKEQGYWDGILSVPEQADEAWEEARERLGRLPLLPLAERLRARTRETYRDAMARAVPLVTRHPERVTASNWLELQKPPGFAPVPPDIPSADAWFGGFPAGTTYDARNRMLALPRLLRADVASAEAYRSLAPYDYYVVVGLIQRKYPRLRTAADIGREFGEQGRFNPLVMHWMAKCCADTDPPLFIEIAERLCTLDPDRCILMAHQLADRGLDQSAALAYQRALDHGTDSEAVSESLRWLVRYHQLRGERAQALRIARKVATSGTSGGMETLALFHELEGRLRRRAHAAAVGR